MTSFREKAKSELMTIFTAAVAAVDPERIVKQWVQVNDELAQIGNCSFSLNKVGKLWVVGAGKAAARMAKALEEILAKYLAGGIVITKYGHGLPLEKITVREAGHPVPDEAGVEATKEILRLVQSAGERDAIFVLISGGGSALLIAPSTGLTLRDKQEITTLLLNNGVPIEQINVVRKHLSQVKGGQLARHAYPAQVFSLILSDVIGDPVDIIASGPTVPDPSTFKDAVAVLHRYHLWDRLPPRAVRFLTAALEGKQSDTPKPGDEVFSKVKNFIIGNNYQALQGAYQQAKTLGYRTLILSSSIQGEAREVARVLAAIAREVVRSGNPLSPPACIIAGGETTVTIRGEGLGGRNQELALAIALDLQGLDNVAFLSAGSDGTDGPTDAAGAFAFGDTVARGQNKGLDAQAYLQNNDSYHYFKAIGDLFQSGPTGTNVMDLQIILVQQPEN